LSKKPPMNSLQKEQKTIAVMIRMFCAAHHGTAGEELCPSCEELLIYAKERLKRCPFGEKKGACSKCKIHCYKPEMRKRVTEVMRYSGPRMVKRHPLLAMDHLLKARGLRRPNAKTETKRAR
jgi:Nitrous oxide-stimulated promoter